MSPSIDTPSMSLSQYPSSTAVRFIADDKGTFTAALGLLFDASGLLGAPRSKASSLFLSPRLLSHSSFSATSWWPTKARLPLSQLRRIQRRSPYHPQRYSSQSCKQAGQSEEGSNNEKKVFFHVSSLNVACIARRKRAHLYISFNHHCVCAP